MKKNIFFAALFISFAFSGFGQTAADFLYVSENGGITITGYKGSVKDVVIPEMINGLPVTAIGANAFSYNRLTGITLPGTVAVIGNRAFSHNRLESVTLPDSVASVGFMAFFHNRLTGITLSNSLAFIGMNAFAENKLKSIILPESLTYIGDGAFTKNLLTSVVVPKSVKNFNSWAVDSWVKVTMQ